MDSRLLLTGGLVPAVLAAGVVVVGIWLLPAKWRAACGALGVALGFLAAYWLLPHASLWPLKHWQWLPYLGLVGMLAAISLADDVPRPARWAAMGLLSLVLALQLVPTTFPALLPRRPLWIGLAAAYFAFVGASLVELPTARIAPRLLVWLAGSALGATLIVAINVSLRYGEVSLAVAPALLGAWSGILIAQCCGWLPKSSTAGAATLVRGILPVYVALAAGAGFIGCIERQPKLLWAAALAPCAPLVLWLVSFIPNSPNVRWRTILIELFAVLAIVIPLVLGSSWDLLTGDGY
jgi:hypothetical protein